MKKRTPEQQKLNSLYQSRFRKRRQLNLTALKFLQNLNSHWPQGLDEDKLRGINMRVRNMEQMPFFLTKSVCI